MKADEGDGIAGAINEFPPQPPCTLFTFPTLVANLAKASFFSWWSVLAGLSWRRRPRGMGEIRSETRNCSVSHRQKSDSTFLDNDHPHIFAGRSTYGPRMHENPTQVLGHPMRTEHEAGKNAECRVGPLHAAWQTGPMPVGDPFSPHRHPGKPSPITVQAIPCCSRSEKRDEFYGVTLLR